RADPCFNVFAAFDSSHRAEGIRVATRCSRRLVTLAPRASLRRGSAFERVGRADRHGAYLEGCPARRAHFGPPRGGGPGRAPHSSLFSDVSRGKAAFMTPDPGARWNTHRARS